MITSEPLALRQLRDACVTAKLNRTKTNLSAIAPGHTETDTINEPDILPLSPRQNSRLISSSCTSSRNACAKRTNAGSKRRNAGSKRKNAGAKRNNAGAKRRSRPNESVPASTPQTARLHKIRTQLTMKNPTPMPQANSNLHHGAYLARTPLLANPRVGGVPAEHREDGMADSTALTPACWD